MVCAGVAQAQTQTPKPFSCGDIPNPNEVPKIEPIFHPNAGLNDSSFDCMAWQDFIFLNWPAMAGERGVPNKLSRFGAAGPTVWETYRTADTVFLPDAANPGPWDQSRLMASVSTSLARQVASGSVRHLTMKSKVSSAVMANILRHGSASPQFLDEISQAGGGTLYDLNGYPVYYEVSMDKAQYDYIVNNGLYNANTQITFAQKQVISLPAGSGANDTALELKAAWKVLSEAERNSGRFHTIQALLDGSKTPVTVGLVGFHMFISNGGQGAWATFAQMDDAPAVKPAASGAFSFFNPKCTVPGTTNPCPFNIKDANPGQVVQITPNDNTAEKLNDYVHALLKNYNPKTPWQYYNLVDVQWATQPVEISKLTSPAAVPLPDGKPNRPVVVNPVLETFVQSDGIGCFSCHTYATVAASGNNKPNFASSYSFTFGRAATPKQ
jgi:hypothetical protein